MNEPDRQLEKARAIVAFHESLAARRKAAPADFYVRAAEVPATVERMGRTAARALYYLMSPGQESVHRSDHTVRLMVPGNGFGKTRCMGTEAAWWLNHSHPFLRVPTWPILSLWIPPDYQQFENVARNILENDCLYAGWSWNENKHRFTTRNGDVMYVYSHEKGWDSAQGSEWDIVFCDEQPPLPLWRELRQRRRAKRQTKYMIGATATKGESWMETELYEPWLEHHTALGLDEDGAVEAQSHPRYFVLPKGGIVDNPATTADDHAWYREAKWGSEAEKRVRLSGGFARFNGSPVFDQAAVDAMLADLKARRDAGEGSRLGSVKLVGPGE